MNRFFSLLTAFIVLGACEKGHNKNPVANLAQFLADRDLQNSFESSCSPAILEGFAALVVSGGSTKLQAQRVHFRFLGDNVTRGITYYADLRCTEPLFRFEERGQFVVDKKYKTNDGGYFIYMNFKRVSGFPINSEGAALANDLKLCNSQGWVAKEEKNVTSMSADFKCYGATQPREQFNIYRVDGKTLSLGNFSLAPIGEAERPSTLRSDKFEAQK